MAVVESVLLQNWSNFLVELVKSVKCSARIFLFMNGPMKFRQTAHCSCLS